MTFDCESELEKISEVAPHAQLVLRIRADDPSAIVQFGHKYGADPDTEAPALLDTAKRLGLTVVGVSFHVGSGSQSPAAYLRAIEAARAVFDGGRARGYDMRLLDIGGGFWGRFSPEGLVQLDEVAEAVNQGLGTFFPQASDVDVIAEPGRYFAESCATMHALVTTVKDKPGSAGGLRRSYYITDGVYGSFNGIIYDHAPVTASVLRSPHLPGPSEEESGARVPSTVFGPTCDGVDLIYKDVPMPLLRRGDWLQFPNFGAYSIAGACAFNGLPVDTPETYYVWSLNPVGRLEAKQRCLQRGDDDMALGVPEEQLTIRAELHDLDTIC
jgi:ornithine decarboxylase